MMRIYWLTACLMITTAFRPQQEKTILFLGDSLTAGYGITVDEAFPAVAGRILNKQGKKVKIINAGISGDTSAGGLARIDWVLRQPADVLFLELGGNDGLRGLPVEATEKNLQAIIDKAKAKNPGIRIVLAGMMVPPNMGAEYSTKFQAVFTKIAARNKCERIPFLLEGVGGDPKLNQADGIHPTVEGHKIIGSRVAVSLGKVI